MDYKTIGITLLVISVAISIFLEWIKIMSKKKYTKEQMNPLFAEVFVGQAQSMQGIVPEWTIYEFIDLLREAANK